MSMPKRCCELNRLRLDDRVRLRRRDDPSAREVEVELLGHVGRIELAVGDCLLAPVRVGLLKLRVCSDSLDVRLAGEGRQEGPCVLALGATLLRATTGAIQDNVESALYKE